MPIGLPAAAIIGSLASGTIGAIGNMSAADRAAATQSDAVKQWLSVNIPDPAKQQLALQQFVQQGTLAPELQTAIKQNPSELSKILDDPQTKATRLRALSSLENIGSGGAQEQDKAAQQQALIESGAANRGHQGAIEQQFANRGQLGSGLQLSAQLQGAQGDADRTASNALQMESDRRNRALQAIQGAGSLAGDIQGQEFNMASQKAQAADAVNRFNAQNAQGVNAANVGIANQAQAANLAAKQNIANQNTTMSNFQQQYNKELQQQQFDNQAKKAAGASGQLGQQAGQQIAAGQSAGNMWGGIAGALAGAGSAYQSNQNNQDYLNYLKSKNGGQGV